MPVKTGGPKTCIKDKAESSVQNTNPFGEHNQRTLPNALLVLPESYYKIIGVEIYILLNNFTVDCLYLFRHRSCMFDNPRLKGVHDNGEMASEKNNNSKRALL